MKKRYYALIFLIILTECLPLIIVFFNTSVRTNCIIVTCALLGWLMLVGVLISCYIQTNSRASKKQKKRKRGKLKWQNLKIITNIKLAERQARLVQWEDFVRHVCMHIQEMA